MLLLNNIHDRDYGSIYPNIPNVVFDISDSQLNRTTNKDWYKIAAGCIVCVVTSSRKIDTFYRIDSHQEADIIEPGRGRQHVITGKVVAKLTPARDMTALFDRFAVSHPLLPDNKFSNGFNVADLGTAIDSLAVSTASSTTTVGQLKTIGSSPLPPYIVGGNYSRNDIYEAIAIAEDKRGGDWLNGYHRHGSDVYIFCNVGVAGRTGHDYDNHWDGGKLVWHGKTNSTFEQQSIRDMISGELRVLVFYRLDDRAPFTYAGIGTPLPHKSTARPVRVDWTFGAENDEVVAALPEEFAPSAGFQEGHRTQVYVNRYERDRGARDACVQHHGTDCAVCGFNFFTHYGELGAGFIHVHHVVPISTLGTNYTVHPITDLAPVCPNCHAMLHRGKFPPTIAELKEILRLRREPG